MAVAQIVACALVELEALSVCADAYVVVLIVEWAPRRQIVKVDLKLFVVFHTLFVIILLGCLCDQLIHSSVSRCV